METAHDCLMITQARAIPECVRAFKALKVPKAWFTGYTEKQLERPVASFIRSTSFGNYLISSDDGLPEQKALDAVQDALKRLPIVTGWSNMSPTDDRANVVLKKKPTHPFIARLFDPFTTTCREIREGPETFRTYFTGLSLLGMRRSLWLRYPLKAWSHPFNRSGFGSDYLLSRRLTRDGHTIVCLREAFMYHTARDDHWLVGDVEPTVTFEDL